MYNTNDGVTYLRVLAPFCLLSYIQAPISSSLQAMGKAKTSMKATLTGTISRIVTLFLFSFLKIGLWPIIIANCISMLITTIYESFKLKESLK
jgi:stage V sporulation protein B